MILNLKGLSGPQTNTFYTSALLRKTKTTSSKTYAPARWSPSLTYGAREIFSISKPLGLRTFSYKSLQPYSQAAVGVATSSFSEGGRRVPSSSSTNGRNGRTTARTKSPVFGLRRFRTCESMVKGRSHRSRTLNIPMQSNLPPPPPPPRP